ncbi:hypothetical protein J4219_09220 [Candidatus Woesearchaeota archaeon]|nr:hypothetical protein [Candidatus Woesearchaeota archaeon]
MIQKTVALFFILLAACTTIESSESQNESTEMPSAVVTLCEAHGYCRNGAGCSTYLAKIFFNGKQIQDCTGVYADNIPPPCGHHKVAEKPLGIACDGTGYYDYSCVCP